MQRSVRRYKIFHTPVGSQSPRPVLLCRLPLFHFVIFSAIERSYRHEQRPWEPTCPAEMLDINLFRTDKGGDPVSLDPRPRHATDRETTVRSRKMAADTLSDRRE